MADVSRFNCFVSKLRDKIWSIHQCDLKKIIPMLLLVFIIAFIYHVLKDIKDTLVITAEFSGAEIIPFLKVWVVLPSAVACSMIFNKLFNNFNRETIAAIIISSFLMFFICFLTILYPNRSAIHLDSVADFLERILPDGWRGFSMMVRYWSFSMFYVSCEMWGVLVLSLLFWGFSNDITQFGEAERFYPLLALAANISGIAAGEVSYVFSHKIKVLFWGQDHWEQSMRLLIVLTVVCGLIVLYIFYKFVVKYDHLSRPFKSEKIKLSLKENLITISKSKPLLCIVVIVLSYNITNNLLEVLWKNEVRSLYPNPNDYNAYINQVTMWIGIVSTAMAIFMQTWFKRFGWTFVAQITPVLLLVTSLFFIPLLVFKQHIPMSYLWIIVFIGSIQNVFMRASKFTVSDASKEMAFISLSKEDRLRGKSAIDGIGSRFGKSGGSILYQIILVMTGSISASTPYIGVLLLGIIMPLYLKHTKSLGQEIDVNNNDPV